VKEVMYNPGSDKLIHMIKIKDEMITVPDIKIPKHIQMIKILKQQK
jgi:hypothetical protein